MLVRRYAVARKDCNADQRIELGDDDGGCRSQPRGNDSNCKIGKPLAGGSHRTELTSGFGRLAVRGNPGQIRGESQASQRPLRVFGENRVTGGS